MNRARNISPRPGARRGLARPIWTCACLAALLLWAGAVFGAARLPFEPGERLYYELKWTIVIAGRAVAEVGQAELAGTPVIRLSAKGRTTQLVDIFYKVRDRVASFVGPEFKVGQGFSALAIQVGGDGDMTHFLAGNGDVALSVGEIERDQATFVASSPQVDKTVISAGVQRLIATPIQGRASPAIPEQAPVEVQY